MPKKQTSAPSCSWKANMARALYGKLSNISPVSTYLNRSVSNSLSFRRNSGYNEVVVVEGRVSLVPLGPFRDYC